MIKTEFEDWKADPRTKEIFRSIEAECYEIGRRLAKVAGTDSKQDRYDAGVIRGMERILEVDFEEPQEDA